jgi:hypothetical protein
MTLVYINTQGEVYLYSNVVEKCLNNGNQKQKRDIVDEILNKEDRYFSQLK